MPPRRQRRTGEGPHQPCCHCPGHHNTFIFSGLTGFETGRYSQCTWASPARSSRPAGAAGHAHRPHRGRVAAGHHGGPLPPLPRPPHPRAPRLADEVLLRLRPRPRR
ncbi:MAG: hypothetical protein MZV64_42495 [Ignavibacteriales bacterium]|nr:hypothetical protein [Ignavibacteriales bacterium]